jgi:hypothetical protein
LNIGLETKSPFDLSLLDDFKLKENAENNISIDYKFKSFNFISKQQEIILIEILK